MEVENLKISCNVTYRTLRAIQLVLCRVTLASASNFNVLLTNFVQFVFGSVAGSAVFAEGASGRGSAGRGSAGRGSFGRGASGRGASGSGGGVQVFGKIEAVHCFGIQTKTGLKKEYAVLAQV